MTTTIGYMYGKNFVEKEKYVIENFELILLQLAILSNKGTLCFKFLLVRSCDIYRT